MTCMASNCLRLVSTYVAVAFSQVKRFNRRTHIVYHATTNTKHRICQEKRSNQRPSIITGFSLDYLTRADHLGTIPVYKKQLRATFPIVSLSPGAGIITSFCGRGLTAITKRRKIVAPVCEKHRSKSAMR